MRVPLSDMPERYSFVDPASGKKMELKKVRARSAIVTVAVDTLGRVFVLEAWAERAPTETLITAILANYERWHPRTIGIEANAMQSLFADSVMLAAKWQQKALPILPIQQPTKIDKDWRIRSALQPVLADGRIIVGTIQHELIAELESFPSGMTKDLVDALASVVTMIPPRALAREKASEIHAVATYLREAGVPPDQIVRRIRELEAERAS